MVDELPWHQPKEDGLYLSYSSKTICRCDLLLPVTVLITPVYHSLGQSFKAHFVIGSYFSHCFMACFQAPELWPKSGISTLEIGKFKVRWTVTVVVASPLIGKVQLESSTWYGHWSWLINVAIMWVADSCLWLIDNGLCALRTSIITVSRWSSSQCSGRNHNGIMFLIKAVLELILWLVMSFRARSSPIKVLLGSRGIKWRASLWPDS